MSCKAFDSIDVLDGVEIVRDMNEEEMGKYFAAVAIEVYKARNVKITQCSLEGLAKVFRTPLKAITQELQTRFYNK